ncbi:hypothetical protein [Enterovirga aerilata]|uniref:Uncharacterized protein n=1 Tax=Enterovirga aerilata TaxID=2730920 RepID=A0A849ICW4_9HYPH|nr:hypothetical protein [Enterovirga sp. DB1703]NNM73880.1 hypothetical protein [Enterovirga sp. DB1703]
MGAALAAFREEDRTLIRAMAEALAGGRLAMTFDPRNGPILVLADRVPGMAHLAWIARAAITADRASQRFDAVVRAGAQPENHPVPAP